MTDALNDSELDDALLSVWRQALIEQKKVISVSESTFSVRRASKNRLAQVNFELNSLQFRGLEQNPQTTSRWAKMARDGARVMQFLRAGRYVGVVADGVMKHYGLQPKD